MTTRESTEATWQLTAPESLVLRDGPGANRAQAIKLGLLELLTRSSLRLVDSAGRNWRGRERVEKILVRGTQPVPSSGALAPIAAAFHNTPEKRFPDGKLGRAIKDVARTFGTDPRWRGHKYVREVVLPELAGRGLYVRQPDHVLGIFPRTRWFLTSEGERRRAELLEMLANGERDLVGASNRDPRQAAALLGTAGAAALLMTSAYPDLAELSRRQRQDGASGDGGAVVVGGGSGSDSHDEPPSGPDPTPDPTPDPSAEPGALDFGTTFDFDLSAFDGIDSAFDAVDSGVDAGGGDGGGGDGGGDGGGGGD